MFHVNTGEVKVKVTGDECILLLSPSLHTSWSVHAIARSMHLVRATATIKYHITASIMQNNY